MREDLRKIRAEAAKKLKVEKKPPINKHPVVVQEWKEHERGWGVRPDGASLHRTEGDRKEYLKRFWETEKKRNPSGRTPEEYSCESGSPFVMDVDEETYRKVCESENGIMMWQSDYSKIKNSK